MEFEGVSDHRRSWPFQTVKTLTLDQVIWLTNVCHSSTSNYMPNFVQIGNILQTGGQTLRLALLGRLLEELSYK